VDGVEVVENEEDPTVGRLMKLADEQPEGEGEVANAQRLEVAERALAKPGEAALDRRDEVLQKDLRVGIGRTQDEPAGGESGLVDKVDEQRRFAVAGRRAHDEQPAIQMGLEEVDQTWARQDVTAPTGQQDLGDESRNLVRIGHLV